MLCVMKHILQPESIKTSVRGRSCVVETTGICVHDTRSFDASACNIRDRIQPIEPCINIYRIVAQTKKEENKQRLVHGGQIQKKERKMQQKKIKVHKNYKNYTKR